MVEGQGRALARLNRPGEARQVLATGAKVIDEAMRHEQRSGFFAFSEAALELCTGTTQLWLGEPTEALAHTSRALALQGSSNEAWMQMSPLLGRFDETHAWAQLGHPDRAATLGSRILVAGEEVGQGVFGALVRKGEQLEELLATHAELAEVRDYTDQLHALMHRPGLAFQ